MEYEEKVKIKRKAKKDWDKARKAKKDAIEKARIAHKKYLDVCKSCEYVDNPPINDICDYIDTHSKDTAFDAYCLGVLGYIIDTTRIRNKYKLSKKLPKVFSKDILSVVFQKSNLNEYSDIEIASNLGISVNDVQRSLFLFKDSMGRSTMRRTCNNVEFGYRGKKNER